MGGKEVDARVVESNLIKHDGHKNKRKKRRVRQNELQYGGGNNEKRERVSGMKGGGC